jgi:hypothetical protein
MPSFLGTALINNGLLSAQQLELALAIQRQTNPLLGELAIEFAMLTTQQVEDITIVQRIVNQRFGDIAEEEKLLSAAQIQWLLNEQRNRSQRLGDILIDQGFVSKQSIADTLNTLRQEADTFLDSLDELSLIALRAIESLFARLIQAHCKHTRYVDNQKAFSTFDHKLTLTIVDAGKQRQPFIRLSIACNTPLMTELAMRFMEVDAKECDQTLAEDALGELLNMAAGYIISDRQELDENLEPTPAITTRHFTDLYLDEPDNIQAVAFESQIGNGVTLISLPQRNKL